MRAENVAAEPLFLATPAGRRFCVFHPPAGQCGGAVLIAPPFGDEMNKSRRMVALQARRLAALGFGVLQLDLEGCGDSDGDLRDVRWAGWQADLEAGAAWLSARLDAPLYLLGLRMGALLALDLARSRAGIDGIVLWQPLASGDAFITQLLRLKLAGSMALADGAPAPGTAALRAALAAGETLEIGGYEITGALAGDLAALELRALAPAVPVHWFEMVGDAARPLPPAAARTVEAWRADGVAVAAAAVAGPAFWSTQEISESEALLDATCAVFEGLRG
ncbi:hydrolase 2, exosortase A system-associated [Massilia soli]|uniref:Hydrolase 2, exosortase A system-associated n=1 Tax=Massilia soli TaxID=2792854 RepID=A0ABS7SIQ6_9BURK|nr:hydrolase 2, exosortase A system-associated [Massilia soli]MBZ2206092.1 hydrolase 2, exosortase A system-associated [Massilia soli]